MVLITILLSGPLALSLTVAVDSESRRPTFLAPDGVQFLE